MTVSLVVLAAVLSFLVSWQFILRRAGKTLDSTLEMIAPLVLRGYHSSRKTIAMTHFIEGRKIACVNCPRCNDFFPRRIFCRQCAGKGYLVIPAAEIAGHHLPNWKGFKREMEARRTREDVYTAIKKKYAKIMEKG